MVVSCICGFEGKKPEPVDVDVERESVGTVGAWIPAVVVVVVPCVFCDAAPDVAPWGWVNPNRDVVLERLES